MTDNSPVLKGVAPWGIHPLPEFVKTELESRPKRYASTDNRSVRSAWSRICSNGKPRNASHPGSFRDGGLVLFGNNKDISFDRQFGFNQNGGASAEGQVIGYDVYGGIHALRSQTFPFRPPPGIESIETEFYGAGSSFPGLCKRATIKWKCFSVEQLEYLTPYLMSLSVSMVLEWGWNDYDPRSLIDLRNPEEIISLFKFPDIPSNSPHLSAIRRMEISNGNYECHVGRIVDYGYTMNSQGIYEGYTVVVNPVAMFDGNSSTRQSINSTNANHTKSYIEFVKNHLGKLPSYFQSSTSNDESIPAELKQLATDWKKYGTKGLLFRPEDGDSQSKMPKDSFWISLRLLEQLLNVYAPIVDTGSSKYPLFNFNFANVIISGRPYIKPAANSTNDASLSVIIPNQFAPRFMRHLGGGADGTNSERTFGIAKRGASGQLKSIDPKYSEFKDIATAISSNLAKGGFTDDYDDLKELIGAKNSFPMYMNSDEFVDKGRTSYPGYWGYLGDIYISDSLIRDSAEHNDTFLKMLESILQTVSSIGSSLWEFRVIPNSANGITVMDTAYCPLYKTVNRNSTDSLVKFTIGQTESSAFTSYGMSVQMKNEMAFQTLLYGGRSSVDTKKPDIFVDGDRLYVYSGTYSKIDKPEIANVTEEEKNRRLKEIEEQDNARRKKLDERVSVEGFIVLRRAGKEYYLNEKDSELMKKYVQSQLQSGPKGFVEASPILPGTEFTFEMPGISGFFALGLFVLDAVPAPYKYDRALFQIRDVKNTIKGNNWTTSVVSQVRPLSITK